MIGRLTFVALLVWISVRGAAHAVTLRIVPSSVATDQISGMATVDVQADDPSGVAIYRLGIAYDAQVIDATAAIGSSLEMDPASCAFAMNDSVDGKLCISIACFPEPTASGAVLATLHLTGNMTATSLLEFDETACAAQDAPNGCFAGDENETQLPCTTIGGSVSVLPTSTPTGTATSTITPTSSATSSSTVTPTSTPTASATATPRTEANLAPPSIGALPGGIACIGIDLRVGNAMVASTTSSISFGPGAPFTVESCAIHPLIGAGSSYGKQLTHMTLAPGTEEFDVDGSTVSLPDGALFSCSVRVAANAVHGGYDVGNATTAFDADQNPIPGVVMGAGRIRVASCSGDCGGDGTVSIGDLQRCISHFLGRSLCSPATLQSSCPSADANLNGTVSIGEVSQCVNHLLGGCDL